MDYDSESEAEVGDDLRDAVLEDIAQALVAVDRSKRLRRMMSASRSSLPFSLLDEEIPNTGDLLFKIVRSEVNKFRDVLKFMSDQTDRVFRRARECPPRPRTTPA